MESFVHKLENCSSGYKKLEVFDWHPFPSGNAPWKTCTIADSLNNCSDPHHILKALNCFTQVYNTIYLNCQNKVVETNVLG